jgi:CshA-type fibril repeat protein
VSETATGLTATADLNINITPANDPPVAVNDQATTDEDTPATGTVLPNDSDIDGDALTVSGFTVNGTTITPGQTATIVGVGDILINSDGTYTFTPAPNFNGTVPPIPYTISDGKGGTATANLNITVRPVNDAPTAVDDVNTTPEDTPVSANVLPNDTDPESDPVTVTGFSVNGQTYAPGSTATISGVGTILLNADGSYTFTPELN